MSLAFRSSTATWRRHRSTTSTRSANPAKPFLMSVNFMKVHQPNMPDPDYIGKSMAKSKFADSIVELDARVGHIMDKVRELGIENNTLVIFTTDNGAWQDVYPDAGYTPFRGTKGTDREGGSRVPCIAWWPGHIKGDSKNYDILGSLDFMATFANLGGIPLPENDREGQADHLRQYRHDAGLFGDGQIETRHWFYFTENELTPGAVRAGTIQGGLQYSRRRWPGHRRSCGRFEPRLEGTREVCRDGSAGLRSVGGPSGTLRHFHE